MTMEQHQKRLLKKVILRIVQISILLIIFSGWCISSVSGDPQMITESPEYDENEIRIRTQSSNNVKLSKKEVSSGDDDDHVTEEADPFKPKTGHVPGGLPMISDSAFSLTILIYVSVAFLLVFFLFCWKTNGNGNGSEGMVKECPLLTNDQIISPPKIIPPTPSCDGQFVDIEMSKIDNEY